MLTCSQLYLVSSLSSSHRNAAPPTFKVVSQWVVLERESRLECLAEGFFPPPVSFSWTREGEEIKAPHPVDGAPAGPDGLYRATGNLTFFPSVEDLNATFGCEVTHGSVHMTLTFQLNFTGELKNVPETSLNPLCESGPAPLRWLACWKICIKCYANWY